MSVCDEGWSFRWHPNDKPLCPVAMTYGGCGDRVIGCGLGLWHEWLECDSNIPPDSCPFAPILRALPGANIHHKKVQDVNAKWYDVWTVTAERKGGGE